MSGNRHSDRVVLQIRCPEQGLSAGGSWRRERTALRGGASGGPNPRDWPADRPLNARLEGRATAGRGGDRQAGAPRADPDPARRRFQRVERRRVGLRDRRRSVRHWLLVEPGSSENKSYWVRLPCLPGVRNGPCGATQDTKPCPPALGTGRRSVHRVLDSERSPSVSSGLPPLAGGNGHCRAPRAAPRVRLELRRVPAPFPVPGTTASSPDSRAAVRGGSCHRTFSVRRNALENVSGRSRVCVCLGASGLAPARVWPVRPDALRPSMAGSCPCRARGAGHLPRIPHRHV